MTAQWRRFRNSTESLADTLGEILAHAEVTEVELLRLTRRPSLRGGQISEEAQLLTGKARAEYRQRGYGFWDRLLSDAVSASPETRQAVFSRAIMHGAIESERIRTSADEFVTQIQNGSYANLVPEQVVSLTSRVRTRGDSKLRHLPMLDFGLRSDEANADAAIDIARALDLGGAIYDSGASYHFFGATSMTAEELWRLMGRAMLLGPLIDHRWIAHQLIDSELALRISTDGKRHTRAQFLVASTLR